MLWIVLAKTVPNTAAWQKSVDWGHEEGRTGGTERVLYWYILLVYHGVFVIFVVVCKLNTLKFREYTGKDAHRRTVSMQCRASSAAAPSRRF